jgi:two-component system, chemotaxis family, chemotaxis protein CheY
MARTVVIVDDYDGFRAAARRLLETGGYRVVGEAADVASARAVVRELRPDVVLLDVLLPDGNGFDVADELSQHDGGTRVVLVSSREERTFRRALSASRACGFVYKGDLSLRTLDAVLAQCT